MENYQKSLKRRMVWWWTWWSLCALMFAGHLGEFLVNITVGIGGIRWGGIFMVTKIAALLLFGWPTFSFFPSLDKLLQKDLGKENTALYAKALILERKLQSYQMDSVKKEGDRSIQENISKMEAELAKHEQEKSA